MLTAKTLALANPKRSLEIALAETERFNELRRAKIAAGGQVGAAVASAIGSGASSAMAADANRFSSANSLTANQLTNSLNRDKFAFEKYQDRRQQQRDAQLQRLLFGETLYGDSADAYPQLKDGSLDFEGQAIVGENGPELISTKKNGKVDVIPLTPPTDANAVANRASRGTNRFAVPRLLASGELPQNKFTISKNSDLAGSPLRPPNIPNFPEMLTRGQFDPIPKKAAYNLASGPLIRPDIQSIPPMVSGGKFDAVPKMIAYNLANDFLTPRNTPTVPPMVSGGEFNAIPKKVASDLAEGRQDYTDQLSSPTKAIAKGFSTNPQGNRKAVIPDPIDAWNNSDAGRQWRSLGKEYVQEIAKANRDHGFLGGAGAVFAVPAQMALRDAFEFKDFLFGGGDKPSQTQLPAKLSPEAQQSMAMYRKMKANADNPYGLPMLKPDKNGRYDQETIDRIKASKSNPITAPGAEEYVRNLPSASSKPLLSPREAFLFYHGNNPMSKEIMSRDTGAEKAQSKQNLDAAKFARNIRNDRFNEIKDRLGDDPKLINEFLGLSDGLPSAILQRGYINDRGKMRDFDLSTLLNAHTKARSRTLKQIDDSKSFWLPESSENTPEYQETLMLEFLKELGYQTAPKGS